MRNIPTLCLTLMTVLAACGTPSDGYYDSNGNWIPNNPYNREAHDHSPLPGGTHPRYDDNQPVTTTVTTYTYDRPGYYDYYGHYVARDNSGLNVPTDMFPPRGMCRVWFTDRAISDQPAIESCNGIQSRLPAGAYVIYGG